MRELFYLLLLRTGAQSDVCCLLSVCAVPDGVEVDIVCLAVLLKGLPLVNRILPLRRTRNSLLCSILRPTHAVFVLSLRRRVVLMLVD